jgi:LysR family nitrogen assimilation transcriptional regulator
VDTAHLKAFLRIAETGSISRAAESIGIAQPSLSQQMLRLEDEIGFALFERTARGVTLTEAGRVFRERARQILQAAEQAVSDARHMRDEARGAATLALPPSIVRLVGVRLIETLAQQAPLVQVRIVEAFSASSRGWLEQERIDLGVLYDLGPLRHLSVRPLASDELVLAGAPGRFAQGAAFRLAALGDEPLISSGWQHGLRQLIEREAARAGVEPRFRHELDALDLIVALVERGAGLAVLPLCHVAPLAAAGRLTIARIGEPPLTRTLSLVRNPSHVLTHASVSVESALVSVMTRLVAEGSWAARIASG